MQLVGKAHQFLTFTTPPNLQAAVAFGLGKEDDFFVHLATEMQRRRDRLGDGLRALGFTVLPTAGTYFLNVDVRDRELGNDDVAYCRWLVAHGGVGTNPLSGCYEQQAEDHPARRCFLTRDASFSPTPRPPSA